jgi:hypothetical protein
MRPLSPIYVYDNHMEVNAVYQLIAKLTTTQVLARQLPALAASILIAEIFYKFHSFSLECVAFLATWFILDTVMQLIARFLRWTWATESRPLASQLPSTVESRG